MATSGIITADPSAGTNPNLVEILQPVTELSLTVGSLVSQVLRATPEPLGIFVQFGSIRKCHFLRSQEDKPLTDDLYNSIGGGIAGGGTIYEAELTSSATKEYTRAGTEAVHVESLISNPSDWLEAIDNQLLAAVKPRLSLVGVLARVEDGEQIALAQDLLLAENHLCLWVDQRQSRVVVLDVPKNYAFNAADFSTLESTAELISTISVGGSARSVNGGAANEGYFETGVAAPVV